MGSYVREGVYRCTLSIGRGWNRFRNGQKPGSSFQMSSIEVGHVEAGMLRTVELVPGGSPAEGVLDSTWSHEGCRARRQVSPCRYIRA